MKKILVANRGEIAIRVMRTAKKMGIKTVAVFSEADRNSPHVKFADEAICIGPAPSNQSYLLGDKIIEEAKKLQVDGIHPGYGFLSENADFGEAVAKNGIIFIGPKSKAIKVMGSKLAAKDAVKAYDIPMVPGIDEAVTDVNYAAKIANEIGYPILIKASAGGGGKGMRVVEKEEEFEEQMERAVSEAISSFGNGAVFIEKFVGSPKHIEIQVLADTHGNVVYLFDRECSIQRRHQKVVEEAPSSVLTPELRKRMGEDAINVAKACNYSGAGTVESKTKQFRHRIPLMHPERIDYWGWYLWLRFMKMSGGQDMLSEGEHQLKIEIRPYMQSSELKVGDLLAQGELKVQVAEIPVDKNKVSIQSIARNSGWAVSKSDYNKAKIESLNKKIAQNRFEAITSLVVIKEGELLLEEYFNGAGRDTLHNTRSVGKSFASTMMGIAIDEGHIKNENMELGDFYDLKTFENYSETKEKVTLKSLLTMSSGFDGNDDDYDSPGNEENMYPTEDWVKFTLNLPMDQKKEIGKDYDYFTAGVVVLGDVIHKSVPKGLVDYSDKKLFEPLGIKNYQWQYTPTNVGNTAGGLQLRSLDYAKFGQLYKDNGKWKNNQLIPEPWVIKSLSKQIKQPYDESSYYGYLFWNRVYTVDGKDYEVSFCTGYGGNKIFIFKDIPFVIVITAQAFGLPYAHAQVDTMMVNYILPALLQTE